MKRAVGFMTVFSLLLFQTFAQTQDRLPEPEEKHALIAGAETLLTNGLFLAVTSSFGNSWAQPSGQSVRKNFSSWPIWEDTDGFKVNQLGHPYQGSLYFIAGRANGFSFYESVAFNILGSVTWETLCESTESSINDMITTTFAAAPAGEILHRLYLEAVAAGNDGLSVMISPMDSLNRLITGRAPRKAGGNIYGLSLFAGAGFTRINFIESAENRQVFSFGGPIGIIGVTTAYGDPFYQRSAIPYEHFELGISLGFDIGNYLDVRIISDGYLLSFSPASCNTGNNALSTGLSLHFDFITEGKMDPEDSTIDVASNALDWTVKNKRLFQNGVTLTSRLHAGATFLGVSHYYSPEKINLKNYGAGTNIKLFLDIEKPRWGRLSLGVLQYSLWTFPGTSALSEGSVFWLFLDAAYSYRISERLSFGIADSFAMENGWFAPFPNVRKRSNTVKAFLTWDF